VSARRDDRLAMGAGAVLSLKDAASMLPLADQEARAWLHERNLVCSIRGRRLVVWADVLEALRNDEPTTPTGRLRIRS
jgi:hypothetical protein